VTVPAPTNPKKQSLMPSSALRRALRAAGHHLSPVVQVGKGGLTEAVVAQLGEALLAHELVKVKAGAESPEDRFELAAAIAALPRTSVAQVIGRTVLVYRKHPRTPRFEAGPPELEVPAPKLRPGKRRQPTRAAPRRTVERKPTGKPARKPERRRP
jgi:RNA-binding protein